MAPIQLGWNNNRTLGFFRMLNFQEITMRHCSLRLLVMTLFLLLNACGQEAQLSPRPTATPATLTPTTMVLTSTETNLSGIKTYLLDTTTQLTASTQNLSNAADTYYDLAKATQFDYATLWENKPDQVRAILQEARSSWAEASPRYERVEGIVAGTPQLADFDVTLDAGSSAAEGGDGVVAFDLTLPDGRILSKPGNLFGVTESTLWGTFAEYSSSVTADIDTDGKINFGDRLPDANVLKAAANELHRVASELYSTSEKWQPSAAEAFTALVVMLPTMTEYFESWKSSRFVAGESSTQRDFVAISRLADIQDILSGLEVVYAQIQPTVAQVDASQSTQIAERITDLKTFVARVYAQEQAGKRFSPEEADILGAEAQNQATAIVGQLTQIAAQLNIPLE